MDVLAQVNGSKLHGTIILLDGFNIRHVSENVFRKSRLLDLRLPHVVIGSIHVGVEWFHIPSSSEAFDLGHVLVAFGSDGIHGAELFKEV